LSDPRLPSTRENEQAGYSWQLSVQQVEFSIAMALDRPVVDGLIS
jgi:hypothetical protein